MAEEVGSGYVSLVPSMRNFSKLVKAELKKSLAGVKGQGVEVPVVPKFDQRSLDESLRANKKPLRVPVQLEPLHDKVHGNAGKVKVGVEIDKNEFRRALLGLGKDSRSTIHQKVEVDTDRDFVRRELAASAREGGSSAALAFSGSFNASLPVLILGGVAALFGAPFIALATGALVLAGGALASVFIGAFLLRGDADLQKATKALFGDVKKTLTEAAAPLKGPFLEAIGIIGKAFKDIAPDIKTFFKDIAKSGGIQDLARGVGGLIKSFSETGALKKLGQAIGPVLSQIGMALPDIGNAISQFIISITKPEFIAFVGKMLRVTADLIRFLGDVISKLASFADTATAAVSSVISGFKLVGNAIVGAVTANMDKVKPLADAIKGIFEDIGKKIGLIPEKVGALITTVKGIPARIKTALGNLGGLLLNSGKALVQGLIDGIKTKFGPLADVAKMMVGQIRNYLPFSPAKVGPFSGKGAPYNSGQVIAGDLAAGMASRLPTVTSAAGQLAGAAAFGSSRTASSAAAAQPTVRFAGPDAILEMLRKLVENEGGGNVQFAFGRGGR